MNNLPIDLKDYKEGNALTACGLILRFFTILFVAYVLGGGWVDTVLTSFGV